MIKFFTTTYPKNMINMSFDRHFEVLFNKIFVAKFGDILAEFWIFEVDAFKSIENSWKMQFGSNSIKFYCISYEENNLPWLKF